MTSYPLVKLLVWAGKLSQVKAMKMHKFVHMN